MKQVAVASFHKLTLLTHVPKQYRVVNLAVATGPTPVIFSGSPRFTTPALLRLKGSTTKIEGFYYSPVNCKVLYFTAGYYLFY